MNPARIFVFASSLVLLFLLVPFPSYAAENLLTNPRFEEGASSWSKYGGAFTVESGRAKIVSATTSTKYIYQTVSVTSGQTYQFSGKTLKNDANVEGVYLRVSWYASTDGSGSQLSTRDSDELTTDDASFRSLTTGPITASASANSAKVKAMMKPVSNLEAVVYFDDFEFEVVEPLSLSFTLPSTVTAGDGFDVPVTVANADPSSDYYTKAVIGESTASASLQKGYTYNSALNKWLAWNGAWDEMPRFTTNADGSASFTLKSKVKDDAASGTYYHLVRIRKVGTEDNLDSSAKTFAVNAVSSSPSSPSLSSSSDPEVTFSVVGDSFKVNKSFAVKIEIKNAKPLHDYYIKVRIGLEESKLSNGRTHNSFYDSWLADNASWSKFPVVHTASDGTESITVSAKVASGDPAGTYIIGVRIRDKETEKNYDAGVRVINVGEEDPSEEAVTPSEALAKEGAVLGTLTELPATGADAIYFGYLGLVIGVILKCFEFGISNLKFV